MKKNIILMAVLIISHFNLSAQKKEKDPVLLTIDNKVHVTKSEFERIYKKNNTLNEPVDSKSLEEYLQLFINFKLKVIEAENKGLDTAVSFKKELDGYRKQLAKPYFVDTVIEENLLREAYERSKYDLRASHILIKADENTLPKDTIIAYNKIHDVYKRLTNGEKFEDLVKEVSEDEQSRQNGGDLGYFTVFQMVYSFETAAYNTPVGEVSPPVRTSYGFHIIKITNKRHAAGMVKVSHIMKSAPKGSSDIVLNGAKDTIFNIYSMLREGADFAELAKKFSDDKSTASKGGEMPMFGTGRLIPEFENVAFSLSQKGELSEPFQTNYGWHILKLLERQEVGSYEATRGEMRNKISKDERGLYNKTIVLDRLKEEYNLTIIKSSLEDFYKVFSDSSLQGKLHDYTFRNLTKPFCTVGDSTYSQQHFVKFMLRYERRNMDIPVEIFLDRILSKYKNQIIYDYEEARLEKKYPEFRHLMQEYHDGILLFELTDKTVWTKAVQDSIGLKAFYEKNKNNYMWDKRIDASIYGYRDESFASEAEQLINEVVSGNRKEEDVIAEINKTDSTRITLEEKKFYSKGMNETIDGLFDKAVQGVMIFTEKKQILVIKNIMSPQPKTLDEARGLITADYQTFLEKEWIASLKQKYSVKLNKKVLEEIK